MLCCRTNCPGLIMKSNGVTHLKNKWSWKKNTLVKQMSDIEIRMRVKHQSLKDKLDDVLKENVKILKKHHESHINVIDQKLHDAEQHVSPLEKNLNEAAKCQPAQALILLQSSSHSSLKFVDSKTKFTTISKFFGKPYVPSIAVSRLSDDYYFHLRSNVKPMSKDLAIEMDDRRDDITLVDGRYSDTYPSYSMLDELDDSFED